MHLIDIKKLLEVLIALRDAGSTVVVIEHQLDVIKMADWIVDMGPEGGDGGGHVVFQGTVKDILQCKKSHTGKFLKDLLSRG